MSSQDAPISKAPSAAEVPDLSEIRHQVFEQTAPEEVREQLERVRSHYTTRMADAEQILETLQATEKRLVLYRLIAFLLCSGPAVMLIGEGSLLAGILLPLPLGWFIWLVRRHQRVFRKIESFKRLRDFLQASLHRMDGDWRGRPADGSEYADGQHPWSADLDLFGPGSLFQLMCECHTSMGRDRLARWMTNLPSGDELRRRQIWTTELAPMVDLRESLAVLPEADSWKETEQLLSDWVRRPAHEIPRWILLTGSTTGAVGAVLLVLVLFGLLSGVWLLPVLIIQLPLMSLVNRQIREVSRAVDSAADGLHVLAGVMRVFEKHSFAGCQVSEIQRAFFVDQYSASTAVRRFASTTRWLNNAMRNQFFAPIGWLCGLLVLFTHRLEVWRGRYGSHVAAWLEATGTLEALISIAAFRYENPDAVTPETGDSPQFKARGLGHPLLPRQGRICNDVELTGEVPLIMISGSNMSGKSTLLRAIGCNQVLACCGSGVIAESLQTYLFSLGTAMRIQDSLQDGRSLFFSVVQRLRKVVDLTKEERPVLFLLDEILHGTNSHDRRRGAEAIIRSLVRNGAMGLVTTHDLALTETVNSMNGTAVNKHLEDHIEDGRMVFDYKLREGVVTRSNAIDLMRMMGLDV